MIEGFGPLTPVAGGDLNEAFRGTAADGRDVFVKTRADVSPGEYAAEAAGLRWLGSAPGGLAVPEVVAVTDSSLALVWVEPGRLDEEAFGRQLAATHRAGAQSFGAEHPMRFGWIELPNDPAPDWASFHAERRLRPLVRLGRERGALDEATGVAVERVADRMAQLAGPPEPPARVHGDLWSGNVHPGADGRTYLVDPAAHGGHREVDLAMLRLFGGPSERAHAAYAEVAPLTEGAPERVALWQLVPLLVHALLFGGGYAARVRAVAGRYA